MHRCRVWTGSRADLGCRRRSFAQHVGNVEFGECAHDLAREAAGISGFLFTN
jgi:hypothetical protein